MKISAIVAAAGSGRRLGMEQNKILLDFGNMPMLAHSLRLFATMERIHQIIVVAAKGEEDVCRGIAAEYCGNTPYLVVSGGKERMDSVYAGLQMVADSCDFVLIHDGARPCLDMESLERLVVSDFVDGAILALPVKETIKEVEDGAIRKTIPRANLYAAQTPQIFPKEILIPAYEKGMTEGFFATDDASIIENAGGEVRIVLGNENNIKVTTPRDLEIALPKEVFSPMRIGCGYDVHGLVQGRPLVLCGVTIPHAMGLLGHSDADVATHALMDAILGAMAKGDIGQHFPPSDMNYKDADSLDLLKQVCVILENEMYRLVNADITIMAEHPKLAPYIKNMQEQLARTMAVPVGVVSVKATTTEKLGFVGREEGIAAHAVVMIQHK